MSSCYALECFNLQPCESPFGSHSHDGARDNRSSNGEGVIALCSHCHRVSWLNQGSGPDGTIALCSLGRKVILTYHGFNHNSEEREKSSMFQGCISHR